MFCYGSSEDRLATIGTLDRRSWVLERRAAVKLAEGHLVSSEPQISVDERVRVPSYLMLEVG